LCGRIYSTYVEYGSADLGIVGKDTLMEQCKDVYEPLDLKRTAADGSRTGQPGEG
jgi:ATP phosphoribosyltransferase